MKSFILSIDQSTSTTRAMLFDHEARLVNRVSIVHLWQRVIKGLVILLAVVIENFNKKED